MKPKIILTLTVLFWVISDSLALIYDFSTKNQLNDWEVVIDKGKWEIRDGVLSFEGDNSVVKPGIVTGKENWSDYTFEFKLRNAKKGDHPYIHAGLRYVDLDNCEVFQMNKARLWHRPYVNGQERPWGPAPEIAIGKYSWFDEGAPKEGAFPESGDWYKVKFQLKGNQYTVWLEGQKILDFQFDEGAPKGKVGLGVYLGHIEFDDFKIDGPGIPSSEVKPSGKLATTWGRMKNGE
ncbi:DUF1080 domain-containing protein [Candidatus Poribacteria bacterium]|nr:DUF1080 domain-containing protein [Candidatus Poribacteria bacterium]